MFLAAEVEPGFLVATVHVTLPVTCIGDLTPTEHSELPDSNVTWPAQSPQNPACFRRSIGFGLNASLCGKILNFGGMVYAHAPKGIHVGRSVPQEIDKGRKQCLVLLQV